ncbi:MAG: alpha/beta fold hydrolase [bacterium]|jgi:hypothetical protein|nr:alpha/beta fold hydrolase [bacterium]MDA8576222.1 alpha/beta hydrolase [Candidatus Marinamargulisbacteria bacterium]
MNPLLIIPGWGISPHCFQSIPNHRIPDFSYTADWHLDSAAWITYAKTHGPLDCLAFSLGGFMLSYWLPDLAPYLKHIYLVGVCAHYDPKTITRFKKTIAKNPTAVLDNFHAACFQNATEYQRFQHYFQPLCHTMWSGPDLIQGLAQLERPFHVKPLAEWPALTLYHGHHDAVAPIHATRLFADRLNTECQTLNAGHFPFLNTEFQQQLNQHRTDNV